MRVLILAAGSREYRERQQDVPTWVMQPLGDRRMIDRVLDLARLAADPADTIIVTAAGDRAVADYLGHGYLYAVQPAARGTGDAVLQARPLLQGDAGPLLILYGDTPLLRRSSIRGLIARHRLKQASLTLLSAVTASPLPYGRVVRDAAGRIVDVVEAGAVTAGTAGINELNIGAYAVETAALWPALDAAAAASRTGSFGFTDCIRTLAAAGQRVEDYRALDEDEVLGINTPEDLEQAALILQKRQLQPRRIEEGNTIHFGTGGWRALIGEGFTLDNVRRLSQALANDLVREDREGAGVLIGFDRRFLSDVAAEAAAEVFAGNNIRADLLLEDAPTPLVTYATASHRYGYGLIFTASHNPAQWNGLKVFATDGSLPLDAQTRAIEQEANAWAVERVVKVDLEVGLRSGMVRRVDYTNEYVDAVEALVDLKAMREAGLRLLLDVMHGVGQLTLEIILTEARCRVSTLHDRRDPLFGGRSPAPDRHQLSQLTAAMLEGGYDLGLALDGDADRIAIIDHRGHYVSTNELLLLLYYYLHQVRGQHGDVARNLATTHLLDRLAAHFGEPCHEVPVGFKHLAASMKEHDVLLAGESSGGLSIRGHILGKDGIFACALVVEMLARTGRTIADMLEEIQAITGRLVSDELNLPATPDMKLMVPRRLAAQQPASIAGRRVVRVSHADGAKFYLGNDNWLLLRFSGTEPLLRIFAEADDDAQVQALLAWAQGFVGTDRPQTNTDEHR